MPDLLTLAIVGAGILGIYLLLIAGLLLAGRKSDARELAVFIPNCVVLLKRLLGDPHVPRARKLILAGLVLYLLLPFDLIPDFIPVVGQLDDVIVAAIALRLALQSGGPELLREHWPGSEASLVAMLRVAYGKPVEESR